MDDHKFGLEPTARANLRGSRGEDNCAMSVQGQNATFYGCSDDFRSAPMKQTSRSGVYDGAQCRPFNYSKPHS